eukprot:TRINITY_DN9619_c0_g1_i4.p1 TRINITY_DN9619_c0_g1~~TRINITY_DN9619_c0_g1_i4.p1  ORF type:complete len:618 (+),score=80.74 TRINITY_DN9619_c0_g1_i4:48-1901(+)
MSNNANTCTLLVFLASLATVGGLDILLAGGISNHRSYHVKLVLEQLWPTASIRADEQLSAVFATTLHNHSHELEHSESLARELARVKQEYSTSDLLLLNNPLIDSRAFYQSRYEPYPFDPFNFVTFFAEHNIRLLYIAHVAPLFIHEHNLSVPFERHSSMAAIKALTLAANSVALQVAALPASHVLCLPDTQVLTYQNVDGAFRQWLSPTSAGPAALSALQQHYAERYRDMTKMHVTNASAHMQWQLLPLVNAYRYYLGHCQLATQAYSSLISKYNAQLTPDTLHQYARSSAQRLSRLAAQLPVGTLNTPPQQRHYVFLAGLEGTGHHVWTELLAHCHSAACTRTTDLSLAIGRWMETRACWDKSTFYRSDQRASFGSALVNRIQSTDGVRDWGQDIERLYKHAQELDVSFLPSASTSLAHEMWKVLCRPTHYYSGQVAFLNAVNLPCARSMMSYPNCKTESRHIHYPDVLELHKLFEAAGKRVRVLVLLRDFQDSLFSTTIKRPYAQLRQQLDTFVVMSKALLSQLTQLPAGAYQCWHYNTNTTAQDTCDALLRLVGVDVSTHLGGYLCNVIKHRYPDEVHEHHSTAIQRMSAVVLERLQEALNALCSRAKALRAA